MISHQVLAGSGEAETTSASRNYPDLHEHLKTLDAAGLLVTVTRPINKDTELHPLVRWQFREGSRSRIAKRSCSQM